MAEYNSSFTGKEIDERLGKVSGLEKYSVSVNPQTLTDAQKAQARANIGADGKGISSIAANADGSWTITYTDGSTSVVNNDGLTAAIDAAITAATHAGEASYQAMRSADFANTEGARAEEAANKVEDGLQMLHQLEEDVKSELAELENRANSGEFDGAPGEPGVSPTTSVSKADGVTTVTFSGADGVKTATINDGKDGSDANVTAENITAALGYTPADEVTVRQLSAEIVYKTPQMFGAVGDGEVDDTDAIQAALDEGGLIYFPAGRYKVTRQLTANKSCVIKMFKPYPCRWLSDYPLTAEDNWMGARIETYSTDGYGLLIGDGVEVDGLFIRAMDGFSGVLLKFDGSIGSSTYPAQVKLSHIRLDTEIYTILPEAMFDFNPTTGYHYILDDVVIGSQRGSQFCVHGFRAVMTDNDSNWANSVVIRNMCIDIFADYPLYVEGAHAAGQWIFDNLTIQSCTYKGGSNYLNRTGHIALVTLKNMYGPCFFGGHIYDLDASNYEKVFDLTNCVDIASYGNGSFDEIDTVLSGKFQAIRDDFADHLNIRKLTMEVESVAETGANRLTLSDGDIERSVDIPSVTLSDEQIGENITTWFEENAQPSVEQGKNKFNPDDVNTENGYLNTSGGVVSASSATTTNFIRAAYRDIVRLSLAGAARTPYSISFYDENKKFLSNIGNLGDERNIEVTVENTAYIRMCWFAGMATYENRHTAQLSITVNEPNISYEPYTESLVGGIASYLVLASPNGTQYTLTVDDDGTLHATPL